MQTVHTIAQLRPPVDQWRNRRERVAFVPTLGNLHDGHLELVKRAGRAGDRVVVSIFVNPTQFGQGEDYAVYPRTVKQDSLKLAEAGAHLLFVPEVPEIYPFGADNTTRVEVPGLTDILCGALRPGHFTGVSTVLTKLFNAVRPHVAIFGEKDYQQLLVVRRLVADLCMPIEIIGVPTIRDPDGLAKSSRNAYLTVAERERAPLLYRNLCWMRDRVAGGERDYTALEKQTEEQLHAAGFRCDYINIRRADDLAAPQPTDTRLIIVAAAWLGKARLIDNLPVALKSLL